MGGFVSPDLVGLTVGVIVGFIEGAIVVGTIVGTREGAVEGDKLGQNVGLFVGILDDAIVGTSVDFDGCDVGWNEGCVEGFPTG